MHGIYSIYGFDFNSLSWFRIRPHLQLMHDLSIKAFSNDMVQAPDFSQIRHFLNTASLLRPARHEIIVWVPAYINRGFSSRCKFVMLGIETKALQAESSLPSPASSESGSPKVKKYDNNGEYSLPSPAAYEEDEDDLQPFVANKAGSVRKCNYCGVTSTPMWRHGPGDYTNLCNSCGVKWRRGKILANGGNRHHLCKPPTPKKQKKATPTQKPKLDLKPNTASTPSKVVKKRQRECTPSATTSSAQKPSITPSKSAVKPLVLPAHSISPPTSTNSASVMGTISKMPTPDKLSIRVAALTNEFADLLEMLPVYKTAEFTTILATCFAPKVNAAYRAGIEVEMSVLDVTPETWDLLRNLVSCAQ